MPKSGPLQFAHFRACTTRPNTFVELTPEDAIEQSRGHGKFSYDASTDGTSFSGNVLLNGFRCRMTEVNM
ncbi:unnamed protein product [Protopolystoma xenopodis]|uniref:Uncharacterized protein n=1 Tax=Protopolystoma xenopodis TaxID=117903 RepID=A0A3S5AHD6_9PLAT|nr:unnamed protein product [Protopolystoma xenopodis]